MKISRIQSVILSAAFLSVLFIQCSKKKHEPDDQNPGKNSVTHVEAVKVKSRIVSEAVTVSSIVRGHHEVYIAAETPGTIVKNNLKLGKHVAKGSLLLQIESDIHKAAYEQMESLHNTATINYEALKELYEQGNASKVELLKARSDVSEALSGLKAKKRAYEKCFLRSPVDGYIAHIGNAVDRGNTASSGTVICRVTDISKLKTTVYISEYQLPFVSKKSRVTVRINSLEKTFKGAVSGIAAGSSPSTGSYSVETVFSNDKNMPVKSGMSASVSIHSETKDTIQTIPVSSVINEGNNAKIFTVENNRVVSKYVKTGDIYNNESIELKEQLDSSTIIITSGTTNLSEHDPVSVSILENK